MTRTRRLPFVFARHFFLGKNRLQKANCSCSFVSCSKRSPFPTPTRFFHPQNSFRVENTHTHTTRTLSSHLSPDMTHFGLKGSQHLPPPRNHWLRGLGGHRGKEGMRRSGAGSGAGRSERAALRRPHSIHQPVKPLPAGWYSWGMAARASAKWGSLAPAKHPI